MFDQSFRSYREIYRRLLWIAIPLLSIIIVWGAHSQMARAAAHNTAEDAVHKAARTGNGTIPDSTGIAIRLYGKVDARPAEPSGIGEWTVSITDEWSRLVHVVERTELPDHLPAIGADVEVRGYLLVNRTVVAAEVKLRDENDDFHPPLLIFEGTVTTAPVAGEKVGLWSILLHEKGTDDLDTSDLNTSAAAAGASLDVHATTETRFGGGVPKVGQKVKVWAILRANGDIIGDAIRLQEEEDGHNDNEIEFEGIVLRMTQRPHENKVWLIESSERLYLVEENSQTKFKNGVPVSGQRVGVKGKLKLSGRVIAQEISIAEDTSVLRFGIVLFKPMADGNKGIWQIRDAEGRNFAVRVDEETVFDAGSPEIGDFVVVRGIPQDDAAAYAKQIHRSAANDEIEFNALVLQRPERVDGSGEWRLGINRDLSFIVVADQETDFRHRIPKVSQWVKIKGRLLADGRVQAKKIEVQSHEDGELVVRLGANVISGTIASRYNLIPHSTLLSSGQIFLFITPSSDEDIEEVIAQMSGDPDVIWTEPNYTSSVPVGNPYKTWKWGGTEESGYVNQIAFEQVNLAPVQPEYQGNGTIVAILDTGVDFNHPALANHLLSGYDMVDDDADPQDEGDGLAWGHGTHVSGIIAQMAPKSQLLPVRVLDTNGRGNTYILAYAVEWAAANGADVINLSLGAEADSQLLRETIAAVIDQGVSVVAAAGNGNENRAQYPAQYDGVISVSAIDEGNIKASFANYGSAWVDIAAPGEGITSTIVGPEGSGYASWSGTSMSASFVSGATALAHEKLPTGTAAEIATLLISNAADLTLLDPVFGAEVGGLLDTAAALLGDGGNGPVPKIFIPFILSE